MAGVLVSPAHTKEIVHANTNTVNRRLMFLYTMCKELIWHMYICQCPTYFLYFSSYPSCFHADSTRIQIWHDQTQASVKDITHFQLAIRSRHVTMAVRSASSDTLINAQHGSARARARSHRRRPDPNANGICKSYFATLILGTPDNHPS